MCPGRSWIPGRKTAGPRQCIFVPTVGPSVCVARTAIDTPDVLCMAARFYVPPHLSRLPYTSTPRYAGFAVKGAVVRRKPIDGCFGMFWQHPGDQVLCWISGGKMHISVYEH